MARGLPQRTAHHLVGAIVGEAMKQGLPLKDLPIEQYKKHEPSMDESVYEVLGVEKAVKAFVSEGSTAPASVQTQIEAWKQKLL